jgi:tetratricopeptide (TPR) repeat protein
MRTRVIAFGFLFSCLIASRPLIAQTGDATAAECLAAGINAASNGDWARAEPALAQAASLYSRGASLSEAQRSQYVSVLNLRATLFDADGRSREAEALYRQALAVSEAGTSVRDTTDTLEMLAGLLIDRGDVGAGERLAARALKISEKAFGRNHPDVARALNALADARLARGELDEAEALLRRSARAAESHGGALAVEASVAARRGVLRLRMGRYAEAEPMLERGLDLAEEAFGPDHPALAALTRALADCYRLRNRSADAQPLYEQSIALFERRHGASHPSLLPSLAGLAMVLERQNEVPRAAAVYERAVAIASGQPDGARYRLMLTHFRERHLVPRATENFASLERR